VRRQDALVGIVLCQIAGVGPKTKRLEPDDAIEIHICLQMRQNRRQLRAIRRPEKSDPSPGSAETAYWEHRKRLQDLIERMELEYDKALLLLHPLGITVTAGLYNQMIAAKMKMHSEWLLYLSWSAWTLGLIATLWSFQSSIHANQKALDRHDAGEHSDTNYSYGFANRVTGILDWISGIFLIIGVISAALFLSGRI